MKHFNKLYNFIIISIAYILLQTGYVYPSTNTLRDHIGQEDNDDTYKRMETANEVQDSIYKHSIINLQKSDLEKIIRKHFIDPSGSNKQKMRIMANQLLDVSLKYLTKENGGGIVVPIAISELKNMFNEPLPTEGKSLEEILFRYETQIERYSVNLGDPRYVAHMTPYPLMAAIFSETLISAINSNQIAFEASPAGTFAELETLRWLEEIVGYDSKNSGGSVVAGGTTANETAFIVAKNYKIHNLFVAKEEELGKLGYTKLSDADVTKIGLSKAIDLLKQLYPGFSGNFIILTSEAAHYSHKKLGGYLGIGSDNVIDLKTKNGRIDIDLLKEKIAESMHFLVEDGTAAASTLTINQISDDVKTASSCI